MCITKNDELLYTASHDMYIKRWNIVKQKYENDYVECHDDII